ncbi:hypothetical protein F4806DRAFT_500112 [Annulohypoxylon nitens]|nr:hypothetical protein F4806DRAFT_500112 [Annulohypoxylon nitens]
MASIKTFPPAAPASSPREPPSKSLPPVLEYPDFTAKLENSRTTDDCPNSQLNFVKEWVDHYNSTDQESIDFNDNETIMSVAHPDTQLSELDPKTSLQFIRYLLGRPHYRSILDLLRINYYIPNSEADDITPDYVKNLVDMINQPSPEDPSAMEKFQREHRYWSSIWSRKGYLRVDLGYSTIMRVLGLEEELFRSPLNATFDSAFLPDVLITKPEYPNLSMAIPRPAVVIGYHDFAFEEQKRNSSDLLAQAKRYCINRTRVWTPYLVVEKRSDYDSEPAMISACLGSASTALNPSIEAGHDHLVVFCLFLYDLTADIYVSWRSNDTYYTKLAYAYTLRSFKNWCELLQCLQNIHQWARTDRLDEYKQCFDRMKPK